jgi:hypothetical protein
MNLPTLDLPASEWRAKQQRQITPEADQLHVARGRKDLGGVENQIPKKAADERQMQICAPVIKELQPASARNARTHRAEDKTLPTSTLPHSGRLRPVKGLSAFCGEFAFTGFPEGVVNSGQPLKQQIPPIMLISFDLNNFCRTVK